jgi:hypothetical protein
VRKTTNPIEQSDNHNAIGKAKCPSLRVAPTPNGEAGPGDLGITANQIARQSPCAVLIVR